MYLAHVHSPVPVAVCVLQEIENVIRDIAEDNHSPSLTPAVLQTCLQKVNLNLPPERTLDEATQDAFIARAFGPYWRDQLYRMTLPLGVVIRAIRRGSLQAAMRGPAAATAAVAAGKIQAVGKFKGKLITALKVGMNEAAPTATSRRSSNIGAADGMNTDRRHSTAEKGESTAAAVGQEQQPKAAAQKSRRATIDAVSAAVAAVLGDKGGPASNTQSSRIVKGDTASSNAVSGSGAAPRRVSSGGKAPAVPTGSPQRRRSASPDAAAANPRESTSRPTSAAVPEPSCPASPSRSNSAVARPASAAAAAAGTGKKLIF